MPRRPSLVPSYDEGKGLWIVHVPPSMSAAGKMERRYFKAEGEAEKLAAKLRAKYHKGDRGGVVGAVAAHQSTESEKLLKGTGLSLLEAVRAFSEAWHRLTPLGATIGEAVKAYAEQLEAKDDPRTFSEAALAFIEEKEHVWSPKYLRGILATYKALPDELLDRKVATVTDADIDRAVRLSCSTKTAIETRTRQVKSLLSGKGKDAKSKPPTLLTITQAAAMLRACKNAPERRAVALLLFAGIRPDATDGEISKLDWSAVREGKIFVSAEVSKTTDPRIIPIRPRLARLLSGHPEDGKVAPPNWKRRIGEIRKAAGLGPDHQDATRHTFASHHLVAFGEDATKDAMGHAEGSRTLFRHYRVAVPTEEGVKYFR
jgi:integrase